MSTQEWIVLGTAGVALLLILTEWLRADLVALLVLLALALTGVVGPLEALGGFSSPVVITLVGLFAITRALEDAGVIQAVGARLEQLGGGSEPRLITLFMGAASLLSLVMNNVAAGAVLLPAALRVARRSEVPPSSLLMPLAFGTLVGGMATTFTTANILLNGLLVDRGYAPLTFLNFFSVGGPAVVVGLIFMALMGRRWLPARPSLAGQMMADPGETYHLDARMWEIEVLPGEKLDGVTLGQAAIGEELGLRVLAIWHGRRATFTPGPDDRVSAGDHLLVLGREERLRELLENGAELQTDALARRHQRAFENVTFTEMVVSPRSSVVGRTLAEMNFRAVTGIGVLAVWRGGRPYRTDVGQIVLESGDALLAYGEPDDVARLASGDDFFIDTGDMPVAPVRPYQALRSILVTGLVISAAILNLLPLPIVMLGGAALMVLGSALTMDGVYKAIEWRVIFLVAGMLPLASAMVDTGLAARISTGMLALLGDAGPLVLGAGLLLVTVLIVQAIGGQVAGLVVGPIAIEAALTAGADPRALAMLVAVGCSMAFLTPVAHPVNALVSGPGGYRSRDFLTVGTAMTVVVGATVLAAVALWWGWL